MESAAGAVAGGVERAASVLPSQLNLNPISQLSPIVIVCVMVIVAVTYVLMRRVFVLPYLSVLEERERFLESADVEYLEAEQCVAQARNDSEKLLAEAAAEAEAMRARAQADADEYRRSRIAESTSKAAARLEGGRDEIASEREAESGRLRSEASECVGLACEQLLGAADEELVEATIDRLMTRQAG